MFYFPGFFMGELFLRIEVNPHKSFMLHGRYHRTYFSSNIENSLSVCRSVGPS